MAVTAALIGAGQRGHHIYGRYAEDHPDRLRFTAVVDPDQERLDRFGATHPHAKRYSSLEAWLASPERPDVAVVASPDRDHHRSATAALGEGLHVLLEKPLAFTLAQSIELVRTAESKGRLLALAHVLRYTPFFTALNRVIRSGQLGDIVTVEHRENVSAFHMAHSFVRGNWSVAERSTPMIVQKCCHDFDVLAWNLQDPVRRLSSFGSLQHFHPRNAPADAAARCTDPCPVERCAFDARQYLNPSWQGWPIHVITDDPSEAGRRRALTEGPYGRCVYTAGSDVVDHQVVAMELESGASVVLVMHGHSGEESRTMRYDGTRATLRARFGRDSSIEVTDHYDGSVSSVPIEAASGGHGGGDVGIVGAFLDAVQSGTDPLTTAADGLESHVLAFAAEEARVSGSVLELDDFRRELL